MYTSNNNSDEIFPSESYISSGDEYDCSNVSSSPEITKEKKNPGLNLDHGFVHHIRNIQVKRDNFDKKVKSDKQEKKYKEKRTRRPIKERQVYVPPGPKTSLHQAKTSYKPSVTSDPGAGDGENIGIYQLSYEDNSKKKHLLIVRKYDNPVDVAKKMATMANIPQELVDRLTREIKKAKQEHLR